MSRSWGFRSAVLSTACAAAVGLRASSSQAELSYDLRAADGGKAVQIDHVGQVVRLELYAIVQGHDGIDNETFYNGFIRIRSDDARVRGSIRADLSPVQLTPRYRQTAAFGGLRVDIDDDGDLDLGRITGLEPTFLASTCIFARGFIPGGPDPVGTRITYNGNPDAEEFLLGTLDFRINSLGAAMELRASIPDTGVIATALYVEDNRNVTVYGVLPTVQSAAAAEPVAVSFVPEPTSAVPLLTLVAACVARRQ